MAPDKALPWEIVVWQEDAVASSSRGLERSALEGFMTQVTDLLQDGYQLLATLPSAVPGRAVLVFLPRPLAQSGGPYGVAHTGRS